EHSTQDGNYYTGTITAERRKAFVFIDFRVWPTTCFTGDMSNEKEYRTVKTLSPNLLLVGALGLVISISGCATKKFVRTTVSPVEEKVGEVDQRTTQNTEQIGEIDRQVSRLDEQVATALGDAKTADDKAVAAQDTADRAVARAGEVETAANAGFTRIDK